MQSFSKVSHMWLYLSVCFVGGKTEAERVAVDMMADHAMELRNGAVRLHYSDKFVSMFFSEEIWTNNGSVMPKMLD